MLLGVHHVQITIPRGAEEEARAFYVGVLGLREVAKPEALRVRGGLWLTAPDGGVQLHVGVEDGVDRAATKAHVAYAVADLTAWRARLQAMGTTLLDGEPIPGMRRFELRDRSATASSSSSSHRSTRHAPRAPDDPRAGFARIEGWHVRLAPRILWSMGESWGIRVAAWAIALALAACGESRLPPKTAARPEGQGWFCWHNERVKHSSSCQRTAEACEGSRRKALAGKTPSEATAYAECTPQPTAGCFTHKDAAGGDAWYCAATYDDCESTARTLGRDPDHAAEFTDRSACATWE